MCKCVYLFDRCIHGKFIGFFLCFAEDDGSAVAAAVDLDHIAQYSCTLRPVARYGQMLARKERARARERERESAKPGRENREVFINSADRP